MRGLALTAIVIGAVLALVATVMGMLAPTAGGTLLCLIPELLGLFLLVFGIQAWVES